jgi:hypothetical protein
MSFPVERVSEKLAYGDSGAPVVSEACLLGGVLSAVGEDEEPSSGVALTLSQLV